ncbi:DEKNAAC102446 [Brettanomyces naardenensis]|uniref:DEKNAAC102446 n=1 Tax=Brettanomyces naardenensis TaxID=13370 RepID=A0A448YL93_BRENA|nr:DEKNAAC102446 [Brettanomyces naardenensis]
MTYSFLDLVKKIDVVPYYFDEGEHAKFKESVYTFISHDGTFRLGYILPMVSKEFKNHPDVVQVDDTKREIRILPTLDTLELRNEKLNALAKSWRDNGIFLHLKGWRNELYTIYDTEKKPYMRLERSFCPLLGVVLYGCQINGYVQSPETGELKLWVPRRSATKPTYPGMLDNTVAGGVGYPQGCLETVIKECYEEAGLQSSYVKDNVSFVGVISYFYQFEKGSFDTERGFVQPEVEYIYDLRIDPSIIPHPVDNEAEDFRLMTVDEVVKHMKNGEFKHNCAGVLTDFFMRHGLITPENEKDCIEIQNRLHRRLPFPTR